MVLDEFRTVELITSLHQMQVATQRAFKATVTDLSSTSEETSDVRGISSSISDDESDIDNDIEVALLILAEMEENDMRRKDSNDCLGRIKETHTVLAQKVNSSDALTDGTTEISETSSQNNNNNKSEKHQSFSQTVPKFSPKNLSCVSSYHEGTDDDDTKRALEILAEMERSEKRQEGYSNRLELVQETRVDLGSKEGIDSNAVPGPTIKSNSDFQVKPSLVSQTEIKNVPPSLSSYSEITSDDDEDAKRALQIFAEMEAKENEDDVQRAIQILAEMEEDEKRLNGSAAEFSNSSGWLHQPYAAADTNIGMVNVSTRKVFESSTDIFSLNSHSEDTEYDAKRALQILAEMGSEETDDDAKFALQILAEMEENETRKREAIKASSKNVPKYEFPRETSLFPSSFKEELNDNAKHTVEILTKVEGTESQRERSTGYMGNSKQIPTAAPQHDGFTMPNAVFVANNSEEIDDDAKFALQILAEMEENEKRKKQANKASSNNASSIECPKEGNESQREGSADCLKEGKQTLTAVSQQDSFTMPNAVTAANDYIGSNVSATYSNAGQPVVDLSPKNALYSFGKQSEDIDDNSRYKEALKLLSNLQNVDDAQRAIAILAEIEEQENKGSTDFLKNRNAAIGHTGSQYNVPLTRPHSAAINANFTPQLLDALSPSSTYSEEDENDANFALQILADMELNKKKLIAVDETDSSDYLHSESQEVASKNKASALNTQIELIKKEITEINTRDSDQVAMSQTMSPLNTQMEEIMSQVTEATSNDSDHAVLLNYASPLKMQLEEIMKHISETDSIDMLEMDHYADNQTDITDSLKNRSVVTKTSSNDSLKNRSVAHTESDNSIALNSYAESRLQSSNEEDTQSSFGYNPESHLSSHTSRGNSSSCSEDDAEYEFGIYNNLNAAAKTYNVPTEHSDMGKITSCVKKALMKNEVLTPLDVNTEQSTDSMGANEKRSVTFRCPFNSPPDLPQQRDAHDIVSTYSKFIEPDNITWYKPSSKISVLIDAIRGASSSRRYNACGTLKMLTSNDRNKSMLARSEGVLDVFRFVINLKPSLPCQHTLSSRIRVLSAIHNLATRAENRALILHAGLTSCLVDTAKDNHFEGRLIACSIMALLARSDANQLRMVNTSGLVTILSEVLAATASGMEVIMKDRLVETSREEEISDEDDSTRSFSTSATDKSYESTVVSEKSVVSEKNDKSVANIYTEQQIAMFLIPARTSACAALIHLSKDCASIAQMCKNKTFLISLAQVCVEVDLEIRTKCIEIVCNLTRFPSNQKILAANANMMQSLTTCLKSNSVDDRKWAARALQNICSNQSSKISIAKQPLLTALGLSAMSNDADEQFAAVAALLNLSCEPGVVTAMSNTRNVVSTLIHLTYNNPTPVQTRLMSCDALSSIGLWLQTVASSATIPDGMETKLPTNITSGWERYD